jgi:hypothetical protein
MDTITTPPALNSAVVPTEYEFKMDGWTPATIPLKRLAQYMERLAALIGSQQYVHFVKAKKGSHRQFLRVEPLHAEAAFQRLTAANDSSAGEVKDIVRQINGMLLQDNCIGVFRVTNGQNLINFPGRKTPIQQEVTVFEHGTIDGMVMRIGGKDNTVPVLLKTGADTFAKCNANRAIAKDLAAGLFERTVRVAGKGQWRRNESGTWEVMSFDIKSFEWLEEDSLKDITDIMRQVDGSGWNALLDPQAELRKLRSDS